MIYKRYYLGIAVAVVSILGCNNDKQKHSIDSIHPPTIKITSKSKIEKHSHTVLVIGNLLVSNNNWRPTSVVVKLLNARRKSQNFGSIAVNFEKTSRQEGWDFDAEFETTIPGRKYIVQVTAFGPPADTSNQAQVTTIEFPLEQ